MSKVAFVRTVSPFATALSAAFQRPVVVREEPVVTFCGRPLRVVDQAAEKRARLLAAVARFNA